MKVGRKMHERVNFMPNAKPESETEFDLPVSEADIFRHWERAMFRQMVEHIASGARYLEGGDR